MNRKDFFKTLLGAGALAALPAAAKAHPPVKPLLTNWMGVPCARLPDITVPNFTKDNLALAYNAIDGRDYLVADLFVNKWDWKPMEKHWLDFDRETHQEVHELGIRG